MNRLKLAIVAVLLLTGLNKSIAQDENPYIIGLGFNFVNDAGRGLKDVFKFNETLNAVPYPSRLSVERGMGSGLGLELLASINRYNEGKIIDRVANPVARSFFAVDLNLKYDLNNAFGETAWFDPFVLAGLGFTNRELLPNDVREGAGSATFNLGLGFNTWFNEQWGLNFNGMGKFALAKEHTGYLQGTAGVVYRF